MQDFDESQVWPLTSATTCYTGARTVNVDASLDGGGMLTARWATERHICQVHHLLDDDDTDTANVSWNNLTVPENNAKDEATIAVGYSVSGDWEVVALLDISANTDNNTGGAPPTDEPQQQQQQQESSAPPLLRRESAGIIPDDGSVTGISSAATLNTTSTGLTQQQQQQQQPPQQPTSQGRVHRRQSSHLSSESSIHTSQLTANFSLMDSMTAITEQTEIHSQQQQQLHHKQHAQPQRHQAQLILRRRNDTGTSGTSETITTPTPVPATEYAARLDFRPLAPLVCQFPAAVAMDKQPLSSSTTTSTLVTGVFLGSADTHTLYWFVPSATNAALESVPLHDVNSLNDDDNSNHNVNVNEDHHHHYQAGVGRAFIFESSIMALAFCPGSDDNHDHCLVVACQDGAIRLVHFGYELGSFTRVRHTTVVVDGPIVCLQVRYLPVSSNKNVNANQMQRRQRHVVAGSLCGYVTELYETDTTDGFSSSPSLSLWDGPYMVAEGLLNTKLQSEDSVLAVHAFDDNSVVLGTLSGRCLLYQKMYGDTNTHTYELVWECRLPYSIHAVCHVPVEALEPGSTLTASSSLPPALLVTTRRSVHLLTPKRPRYSAALAKERIEKLLLQHKLAPAPEQEQQEQEPEQPEPEGEAKAKEQVEDKYKTQQEDEEETNVPTSISTTPPVETTSDCDDIVTTTTTAAATSATDDTDATDEEVLLLRNYLQLHLDPSASSPSKLN